MILANFHEIRQLSIRKRETESKPLLTMYNFFDTYRLIIRQFKTNFFEYQKFKLINSL